jgi:hypothetical protein
MKLTSAQVERTLSQLAEGQAIPNSHPVIPQLNELFGDQNLLHSSTPRLWQWGDFSPLPRGRSPRDHRNRCCLAPRKFA